MFEPMSALTELEHFRHSCLVWSSRFMFRAEIWKARPFEHRTLSMLARGETAQTEIGCKRQSRASEQYALKANSKLKKGTSDEEKECTRKACVQRKKQ